MFALCHGRHALCTAQREVQEMLQRSTDLGNQMGHENTLKGFNRDLTPKGTRNLYINE